MGIADRCASIRWPQDVEPDLENLLEAKEEAVLPKLLQAAEDCLRDGADVLCLGSTTMHGAHSYLTARLTVPVINPGPLSYKMIELMLALGLRHSPTAHPRPAHAQLGVIAAMAAAAGNA